MVKNTIINFRSTAWDLFVVSYSPVFFLSPIFVGSLYFIAQCSLNNRSLGLKKKRKRSQQKLQNWVYPAETNLILSLAMTSIFVVHICLFKYNILTAVLNLCCVFNVLVFNFCLSFIFISKLFFLLSQRHSMWLYAQIWKVVWVRTVRLVLSLVARLPAVTCPESVLCKLCLFSFSFFFLCCISQELVPQVCL